MLSDLLQYLRAEAAKRDPRITGLELVLVDKGQNRLHLVVTVMCPERREMRLPVTVSLHDVQAGNVSRVTGLILQAVDLGTWGPRDFKQVRDSVSVTA
ncbi:hypothetical protein [Desulfoscipio geothermicus]|uniref:Uncharacterized protein n=1 Tax=Desulfoscipio geothermicus DSM 3669 TaxID=1121426 RepID=A0A1I6EKK5_9FIRM|nr:hypothetical protein [Desulfoscipio geothermicus]SFR18157.1 hypothetical protein SAMN05660706_1538 [Desulfoscipio geothermicus DSM 3669]